METIKVLNKRLTSIFGKEIDGRSRFRIVFSDTQYEKRYGIFEEYYGDIFLREVTGVKEVPKYGYIKSKHVLEQLFYGTFPDRPFETSSYEPIWTFMDKDRNPLYPVWPVCEIVIKSKLEGIKRTLSDWVSAEEEIKQKEIKEFEEMLDIGGGVQEYKNQFVNIVKPVFIGGKSFEGNK